MPLLLSITIPFFPLCLSSSQAIRTAPRIAKRLAMVSTVSAASLAALPAPLALYAPSKLGARLGCLRRFRGGGGNGGGRKLFSFFGSSGRRRVSSLAGTSTADVRVATYNVLSSSLCAPSDFTSCTPENLEPAKRLPRVLSKLENEIKKEAVICLQEISRDWAGKLHTFFHQRGYHFVTSLYGDERNGYMGVGLAFPSDKFEAEKIDLKRLVDSFHLPKASKFGTLKEIQSYVRNVLYPLRLLWKKLGLIPQRKKVLNEWADAGKRRNTMIYATLRDRGSGVAFGIATYHMPCAFYAPKVMILHSAMAAIRAATLAEGLPVILAGDFNIIPGSECYQLITEGTIPVDNDGKFTPTPPKNIEVEKFWEALPVKMKSAYKEVYGAEPEFTNYAQTLNRPAFIETLDYIFTSQEVMATDALALSKKDEAVGPYPTENEPSDHALIAATLRIPYTLGN